MTQSLNRPRTRLAVLATTALLLAGGSAAALAQPASADGSHDDHVVRVASDDGHHARHHARHHVRHHARHGSHLEPGDDHGRHGGHGADD